MVDRDLFWPVGLVLEQQGGEAGAGSGRLAATNSCRGASDNGSAAAASVARDVDAGGELEWGAELGSSDPQICAAGFMLRGIRRDRRAQ